MLKLVNYHVHRTDLPHVIVLAVDRYLARAPVLKDRDLELGKTQAFIVGRVLNSVIAYLGAEARLVLVLLSGYLIVRTGYFAVV